ncbi:MAG: response regulator [Spirulina sp. SIO3F2]|nr:response regulator [Spirulina sp. SIO3F2]
MQVDPQAPPLSTRRQLGTKQPVVTPQLPHQEENSLHTQLTLFQEQQFTGRIDIRVASKIRWSLYLVLGRFAWASGGEHPARRWRRQLLNNQLLGPAKTIQVRATDRFECWDYQILTLLARRRVASTEIVIEVIRGIVHEVLFEMAQATQLAALGTIISSAPHEQTLPFELRPNLGIRPSTSDTGIWPRTWTLEMSSTLKIAWQTWETWNQAGLALYSPNLAPLIKQSEVLKQKTSVKHYRSLRELVNGKRTLNDLATLLKKDVLAVTRSLLPYIRQGWMELKEIPDLPIPIRQPQSSTVDSVIDLNAQPLIPGNTNNNKGVVVCIDDNPQISETLEEILQGAGYKSVWVADAVQAIPELLKQKPILVFLDLMMPVANGYEICSQIRRIAQFKSLPVVILTSNDGLVDRVRAKMVGATDFLPKPIEAERILATLAKHVTVER